MGRAGFKKCARVGQLEPAWIQHITREEKAGERKSGEDIIIRCALGAGLEQECGQGQQPVLPGLPGLSRYGPSRSRRDIGKIEMRAACRAAREIKPKTKLGQKLQLEPHQACCGGTGMGQQLEQIGERSMKPGMRIPFRQQPAERGKMGKPVKRMRDRKQGCRARIEGLDAIVTQMLVQARLPYDTDAIAGLQHRPQPRARPSPHQAKMTAVITGHQLKDGVGLPMTLASKNNALIGPLHSSFPGKFETHGAIAVALLAPAFPHLDKQ